MNRKQDAGVHLPSNLSRHLQTGALLRYRRVWVAKC